MAGTREDATLLIELAKWGAMIDFGEASRKIWADDFDPDAAEARDPEVQTSLIFFETVGTLVKNGLLDRDLVYDWLWVAGVWERLAPAATRARERSVPQLSRTSRHSPLGSDSQRDHRLNQLAASGTRGGWPASATASSTRQAPSSPRSATRLLG
jgi:hypothetical protein